MAVAAFDYGQFSALFPELANGGVTEPVASLLFGVAGQLLDNTDCSPVQDVAARLTMLNYVVAHLASLGGYPIAPGASGPAPSGIVGRVSSAREGDVSVSSQYAAMSGSEAFWSQTQYGAIYWNLTRAFRTMRYVPATPRYFGPASLVGGWIR